MKITGFDELQKKPDKFAQNAAALDGEHSMPVSELLTSAFVARHTQFASADKLLEQSGFKIESQEDFAAIPDKEWDECISVWFPVLAAGRPCFQRRGMLGPRKEWDFEKCGGSYHQRCGFFLLSAAQSAFIRARNI